MVYKAWDTHLHRDVAIKILSPRLAAEYALQTGFVQEARCAAALNHPKAINIHNIAQDHDFIFIVMEYVPGQTLARVIPKSGLPFRSCLHLAVQIAEAVSLTHAGGLIYRDLKPANIMVTKQGDVKLIDFGLATLSATKGRVSPHCDPTSRRMILGTAGYMSPEQVKSKPADARSDIFSFGVVLYEMATGTRIFHRQSTVETLVAVLRDDPPRFDKNCSPALLRIVRKCLAKDPRRRYRNMKEAIADLKSASLPR